MSMAQSSEKSVYAARRPLALDSQWSDTHVALAEVYDHEQRFIKSLAVIERAVVLALSNAFAWTEQGNTPLVLGRRPDAEALFCRALALNPLVPIAHLELAQGTLRWASMLQHLSQHVE